MSKAAQWRNTPEGASGSSTTRTRLLVPSGSPDHVSGGEISVPSQVYCDGISPPGGIAGLASIRGMVLSTLPKPHSTDRQERLPRGDKRWARRLRTGLLVFPNLIRLGFTASAGACQRGRAVRVARAAPTQ